MILIYHSSHHITSTANPITFLLASLLPPFIIVHNVIPIIVPSDSSRGKIWKNPTGPRCALSPVLPFLTCLLPDHYSISPVNKGRKRKDKQDQSRGTKGAIRTWLPPVPDGGMEMKEMGWGQLMADFCRIGPVGLGSLDSSTTEEERREKRKKQSEEWQGGVPQGLTRDQGWGPSLPLPISPVFCIEYPCGARAGILAYLVSCIFLPLSSHLTYFPFGRCRKWRLISVTVTAAFPLGLVVLPRPTTFFNIITSAFNR